MGRKTKKLILIIIDIILINISFYLSFYLKFDSNIPLIYLSYITNNFIIITVIKLIIFSYLKLYKNFWKYASIEELIQILAAVFISNIIVLFYFILRKISFPQNIYILIFIIDILFVGGSRLSYRVIREFKKRKLNLKNNIKRIMIIGAGDAGAMIIREFKNNLKLNYKPIVVIDDDEKKIGQRINGIPILGRKTEIVNVVKNKNIDEIIIAIPSADKKQIRDIIDECKKTKCKIKILPNMSEYIESRGSINNIRYVKIEDLLGREEVKLKVEEISEHLKGKNVLVTGGGGSIGSELCRQISKFNPKKIIILDIYENNAYNLLNEIKRKYKNIDIKIIIASIRDKQRINEVIKNLMPDIVFHAAAHKHVPLMESNPKEAIKNNVLGTVNVVLAAHKYHVKRFVMISTDKAVNPTNVMGASKRLCEMYIQSINNISKTEFVAVRFGNVLGSNGSVIPLFKEQISEGGPVTVTHKNVIRYFMTIQESVQLVIQAGAMALGGEIFILDMGEPVKILNLAEDLIKLSGFEPYKDIPIVITGLRDGEKLYEELLLDGEGILSTNHEKIFIAQPQFKDYELLVEEIEKLKEITSNGNVQEVKDYLQKIVPNYKTLFIKN
ncbi:polysaccharide biosynthesis protein [Senegalia massiliensis]|uniref:Polysaccharide biosynthesis protein n=1 Tax=Senegalia massiliensis TaxID=1720316 RepID=A0A845R161_9CLOT|nr:nucleoside-diphosphate sugar epimerase/dehydratase [Senegalia massiliensis]NBI07994.1 polysaccharide biosynthesis protein [Senegalia massiliensis]